MAIPQTQLQAWSNAGAAATASSTYEAVDRALRAPGAPTSGHRFDLYLQGSYRNSTNIRGDSDVDVVAELSEVYLPETNRLASQERARYDEQRSPASYTLTDFRRDVLAALSARFGTAAVTNANKCVKVAAAPGRLAADVVVCLEYREFTRFVSWFDYQAENGMAFWTQREHRLVINWPKQHIRNGEAKNGDARTGGRYKPNVRVFKNAENHLVDRQVLGADVAPSYFLECLVYNVPDALFQPRLDQSYVGIVNWLSEANLDVLGCGNGRVPLFGPTPEQWSIPQAQQTIRALIHLWNNWPI